MRNRPKSDPIDPQPPMPRGETEFEEKRIACDFQLVFSQVAQQQFASIKDTYEFVYRKAYIAGKSRREEETINSVRYPSFIKIL